MKIIMTGGTGFIGTVLANELTTAHHQVTILTRNPSAVIKHPHGLVSAEQWDGKNIGAWANRVDGADAVINLAGELIGGKRWSGSQKECLVNSRIDATKAIVEAIRRASKKPRVLVSASAVGYYGHVDQGDVTEDHPSGSDFLAGLCRRWEEEALSVESSGVRIVIPRIGVVLGSDGGALPKLLLPFRLFAGGPLGSGRQWFPWVHRDDVIRAIMFAVSQERLTGPVNVVAPESLRMNEFCKTLGTVLHRPSWAPVPSFLLRVALGEMSTIVLTGQKVVPQKLLQSGYSFSYQHASDALQSIIKKS